MTEPAPGGTPAPADPPKADPPADPKPTTKATDLPDEALKERLARERQAGAKEAETKLAESLGITVDEAKEKLELLKKIEDESKSEQQRLQEERDALKPRADRASVLEKRIEALSIAEYDSLSDDDKKFVDDLAGEGESVSHDERIRVIAAMKKRRGQDPAPEPKLPKGSTTSNADPAPKAAPEPDEGSPDFHYNKWKELPAGSLIQAAYWNDHGRAIAKSESFTSNN